jgi:hypothetical protein
VNKPQIDWRRSPVDIADELVPIEVLMRKYGWEVPDVPEGTSLKIHCMWGFQHADGGVSAALRIYPSPMNRGICFAGCGTITPTRLYAEMEQLLFREAGTRLLEEFGYRKPHWTERAARALKVLNAPEPIAEFSSYALALVTYVRGQVGYREYDTDVLAFLNRALTDPQLELEPSLWLLKWKEQLGVERLR